MITLENVSLYTPGYSNRAPILLDANVEFRMSEKTGILAAPGSGKSSLARMLAGIERPDRGMVHHGSRVSWPIGIAGFLHPDLKVGENLNIFARMVGMPPNEVVDFCEDFCGLSGLVAKPMRDLSPTQRFMLSYACAMSVPGDVMWIADEVITISEPREKIKCDALLKEKLTRGGLVFISRNARQISAYCDRYFVLANQHLIECDDLSVAQEALELSLQQSKEPQKRFQHA